MWLCHHTSWRPGSGDRAKVDILEERIWQDTNLFFYFLSCMSLSIWGYTNWERREEEERGEKTVRTSWLGLPLKMLVIERGAKICIANLIMWWSRVGKERYKSNARIKIFPSDRLVTLGKCSGSCSARLWFDMIFLHSSIYKLLWYLANWDKKCVCLFFIIKK
jgi:hypothetical protein